MLGYFLPQWLPLIDRGVAIGVGVVVLLCGGLLHEVQVRRRSEVRHGERLVELRRAMFHVQEDLAWSRREMRVLGEALEVVARAGRGGRDGRAVEEVMAEVRVLKSLVQQRMTIPETAAPPPLELEPEELPLAAACGGSATVLPASYPPIKVPPPARPAIAPPSLVLAPMPREVDEDSVLGVVRAALRDDRIELVVQPIVGLPQRRRLHYECFTRLKGPDGTLLLPEQYIEVAEREGLIAAIDNMLLLRCIQEIRKIQRSGGKTAFFCNISPHTLKDQDFFGDFVDFLDANHDLAPNLIFEFAQGDLAKHGPAETRRLNRLAMLGCRFSMDQVAGLAVDVTGLNRRRIAFVKIGADKLLAEEPAPGEIPGAAFRRLKQDLGREGIDLIVEKIEDEDDLLELLDQGVDLGQGFLFGEPRPAGAAA